MTISLLVPTLSELHQQQMYALNASTIRLVGKANKNLVKKFSYDAQQSVWQFNKAGIKPDLSNLRNPAEVAAQMQAQVGGGGEKDASLYSVDLPTDATKGVTYHDNNTDLSFSLVPQFKVSSGQERAGRLIYPFRDGGKLVYTAMNNGMKEDIVLSHNIGDELQFSYKLNLPKTLEARLLDDGSLGIYSADPALFGNITYGSDVDQAKIERARQTASKDHLLFALPAPVIKRTGSNANTATAHFALQDNELFVSATGLSKLTYPVSIDPSVVVTSSSDFATGNNEGNIDFNTDQINGGEVTGGTIGAWTATSSFATARYNPSSAVYNGYMYVLGGNSGSGYVNDVQYAPINADGTVGTWTATASFSTIRDSHTTVAYNGYLYVIGGVTTGNVPLNDVQYAPINADGSIGAWANTTSITNARWSQTTVVYNGYMYVLGGYDGSGYFNDVQYALIKADGTINNWTTTSFPTARNYHSTVAYNGYMYVLGGYGGGYRNDVQYAPINADGSLGAWAATASFTTARFGQTTVAYNGYLYLMGGTSGSTDLSDVQYAPINADGTIGTWTPSTSLPAGRNYLETVVYNGYIYLIGGYSGGYKNDVQYAKIALPGATGGYAATTNFATGRYGHTTVAYNGYLYVLGGNNGAKRFYLLNDVQYAPINANGTIGTWSTTTSFTNARYFHRSVAYNGYMYVLGGWNGSALSDVQYAPINADGTIGTWTATTSFTNARFNLNTVTYNGYLYVLGGYDSTTYKNDVQYAPINADGTIGVWTTTSSFSTPRDSFTTVAYGGYLYITGGVTTGSTPLSDVQYAPINQDGTIGTWATTNSFSTARWGHTAVAYDGYIYVLGGYTGSSFLGDVQYAPINQDGTIGTWATATGISAVRYYHTTVAYNGYMYVLGGYGAFYYSSVEYARINDGGPGTTGTWTTSANSLSSAYPSGLAYERVVANNNYIYSVGGYDGTASSNKVYYAPINTDGSIGSWTATSSLVTARYSIGTVVHNGYMYVFGGQTSGATRVNSVEYAAINSDGTLGSWSTSSYTFANARSQLRAETYNGYVYVFGGEDASVKYSDVRYAKFGAGGELAANAGCGTAWCSTNSFTTSRTSFGSGVYNGYLYVIGGNTGSTLLSDVQYALINVDGTLGNWLYTTSLPVPLYAMETSVANGFIYVYGGINSISRYTNIYLAPIASNGGLGGWDTAVNQFATKRDSLAGTIYNGKLYIVGGFTSTGYLSDVQYSSLDILPRIGHYSKLIDLGTESLIGGIIYNGTLPGGAKRIAYRTAGSDGIFGASATTDTLVGSGDGQACGGSSGGTVRYVWVFVTIDDSAATVVFPRIAGTTSNLTDLTVTYTPNNIGHAPPDRRLHNGKFFKNEVLQPLDTCVG